LIIEDADPNDVIRNLGASGSGANDSGRQQAKATQTSSRITPLAQIPADRDVNKARFYLYKL
jgi:hypothetical protein